MTNQGDAGFLREVADEMLEAHGFEHPRHEMWVAIADLLITDSFRLTSQAHAVPDQKVMEIARCYRRAAPVVGENARNPYSQ